jgi:hypothetical protein
MVEENDLFGEETWEAAESTMQKEVMQDDVLLHVMNS